MSRVFFFEVNKEVDCIQFLYGNRVVAEVYPEVNGRNSIIKFSYMLQEKMDFKLQDYLDKNKIGIQEFDSYRIITKSYNDNNKNKALIIKKLEEINEISRKKWLSQFPSHFNVKWNGHWKRCEILLEKELDDLEIKYPFTFKEAIREADVKKYYISRNEHDGRVGLDTQSTPQGGGIIAQSDSFENTRKIAKEIYGINKYFIY